MSNLQGTSTRKQLTTSTLCFTRKDSSGNNIQTGDYHDGEQLDSANRAENQPQSFGRTDSRFGSSKNPIAYSMLLADEAHQSVESASSSHSTGLFSLGHNVQPSLQEGNNPTRQGHRAQDAIVDTFQVPPSREQMANGQSQCFLNFNRQKHNPQAKTPVGGETRKRKASTGLTFSELQELEGRRKTMFDFNIFKAKRNKANSDIVLEREPSDAAGVPGMFKKRNKDQLKPRASVVDNPSSQLKTIQVAEQEEKAKAIRQQYGIPAITISPVRRKTAFLSLPPSWQAHNEEIAKECQQPKHEANSNLHAMNSSLSLTPKKDVQTNQKLLEKSPGSEGTAAKQSNNSKSFHKRIEAIVAQKADSIKENSRNHSIDTQEIRQPGIIQKQKYTPPSEVAKQEKQSVVPQRINFKREEGNVVHSHSQFINIKKSLIESVSLEPILTRSDNMGVVKTEPAVKESLKTERPQNQAHIYSEIRASIRSTNLPTQQKLITIDNFEIYEKRGKGAFGDIFMARQTTTNFLCVLKRLSKRRIRQNKLTQFLLHEIKIQFYVSHENLLPLFGIFSDEDYVYLILELMPDGNVQQLRKRKNMSEKQVAYLVRQVAEGLKALHCERVIHRDLKPENLLLIDGHIKIADFGCSIYNNGGLRTTLVGCPEYFSPEQLNKTAYSDKIDVWSIGILTYELLYGLPPFSKDIVKIVRNEAKPELSEVYFPSDTNVSQVTKDFIRKLLAEDPEQRIDMQTVLGHSFMKEVNLRVNPMNEVPQTGQSSPKVQPKRKTHYKSVSSVSPSLSPLRVTQFKDEMSIKAVTAANSKVQTTANSPIASRQLAPQISTKNPVSNSTGQNFQSIKHKIHVSQSSRDDNQRTTNTKSDCQLTPRQNIAVGNGQNEKLAPLPIQLITSYKTIPHQQNGQCHSTGPDPNRPRLNGQQQVPIQNGDNHKGSKPMNHTRLVQHASNLTPPSSFYSPFQFDLPNKMSHKPNPLHE